MTPRQIKTLRWVVEMAADWRGQYTGHPDAAEVLAAFDKRIAEAKQAVRDVVELNARMKGLEK